MNPNLENTTAGPLPDWPRQSAPGEEAEVLSRISAIKEPWNKKTKEEASEYIADLVSKIRFYEDHAEAAKVLRDGATIVSVEEYTADRKKKADKLRAEVIEAMESELAEFEAEIATRQAEIDVSIKAQEAEIAQLVEDAKVERTREREALNRELEVKYEQEVQRLAQERAAALNALTAERDELVRVVEEAKAELARYEAEIQDATVRLATVVKHFNEVHQDLTLAYSGYNDFHNPAADATDLASTLETLKAQISETVNSGSAVWVVGDNSVPNMEDETLREYGALVLNAYNQDIENAIISMESNFSIRSGLERTAASLVKANRLGEVFGIAISDEYHALRTNEVETAFTLQSRREADREQEKLHREFLKEQEKKTRQIETRLVKIDEEREVLVNQFDLLESERRLREEQGDFSDEYASNPEESPTSRIRHRLGELKELETRIRASIKDMNAGYVYVLSNVGAFGESIVKISMTRSSEPEAKIRALNNQAVPFQYDIHTLFYSDNAANIKDELHRKFADHEVNKANKYKEFFHVCPAEVRDALLEISDGNIAEFRIESQGGDFHRTLEAPLPDEI
jgi:chromosome segregation ATPase